MLEKIRKSKYFNSDWYSNRYPDVVLSGIEPAEHYFLIGAHLQRDPGPEFSVDNYLNANNDIKSARESGFLHYLQHGEMEQRQGFHPSQDKAPSTSRGFDAVNNITTKASDLSKQQPKRTSSGLSTVDKVKIVGDLNIAAATNPMLRGWVAEIGQSRPRVALVQIDGESVFEVVAGQYREDLKKNKINDGRHAFEVPVPLAYIDGEEHEISLVDKQTGDIVKRRKARWKHNRNYIDFNGFLANSYVNPYISRPFREEDKRCFAAMENIAANLIAETSRLKRQPLVSVIMPCFNRMETIGDAVQSVLNQNYENYELIIVDDASTDGTLAWCRSVRDRRVKVIALKENSGASAARNAGLKKATGTYITYLDSDNLWDPRYISTMVGAFKRLPNADAIYSGQYIYHGENSEPSAVRFGSLNKSLLFNHNYIDMNAFCHTRSSYKRLGGFDVTLKRFIDWDLILRFAQKGNMYSIPVLLCHYYLGKASNTITANKKHLNQLEQVRDKNSMCVGPDSTSDANRVLSLSRKPSVLSKKVSVVIPSYESLTDLSECIDSVIAVSDRDMVDIIVVDNASAEQVTAYIKQKTSEGVIKSICNSVNYGFTYAVNQGISIADPSSDLILLNNDAIMTGGAIEALQRSAYQLPDCGLVVPQQVLPGGTKTIREHVPYANPDFACDVNLSAHHSNITAPTLFNNGEVTELTFAPFFCVYIPRHVYEKVGPLDAQYGRHYRSDRIYCDAVRHIHKLKIYHVYQSLVFHKLQKATDTLRLKEGKNSEFDLMFSKNQWDDTTRNALGFTSATWDC